MQRVVNCVITDGRRALMLQKPRRGFWYAPGGKMEAEESLGEAVAREVWEETTLRIRAPKLRGVFVIVMETDARLVEEWMLFTFVAREWEGTAPGAAEEGILAWQPLEAIATLPMPAGDRIALLRLAEDLDGSDVLTGKFVYTPDFELLSYAFDDAGADAKEGLRHV